MDEQDGSKLASLASPKLDSSHRRLSRDTNLEVRGKIDPVEPKQLIRWDSMITGTVKVVEAPEGGGRTFAEEIASASTWSSSGASTSIMKHEVSEMKLLPRPIDLADGNQLGATIRYMLYRDWSRKYHGPMKPRVSNFRTCVFAIFTNTLMLNCVWSDCFEQSLLQNAIKAAGRSDGETVPINFELHYTIAVYGAFWVLWMVLSVFWLGQNSPLATTVMKESSRINLLLYVFTVCASNLFRKIDGDPDNDDPYDLVGIQTGRVLGQSCSSSFPDKALSFCVHWYPLTHLIMINVAFIWSFLYRVVYSRFGKWYLLRSKFLTKTYVFEMFEQVLIEVPCDDGGSKPTTGVMVLGYNFHPWKEMIRQFTFKPDVTKVKRRYLQFVGEVDNQGRPHGFGYWKDFMGERLTGYWRHGRPIGPYKARVLADGSGFTAVKLGYCRYDPVADQMSIGVAHVEASTTGQFYSGFPKIHNIRAPLPTQPTKSIDKSLFANVMGTVRAIKAKTFLEERRASVEPRMSFVTCNPAIRTAGQSGPSNEKDKIPDAKSEFIKKKFRTNISFMPKHSSDEEVIAHKGAFDQDLVDLEEMDSISLSALMESHTRTRSSDSSSGGTHYLSAMDSDADEENECVKLNTGVFQMGWMLKKLAKSNCHEVVDELVEEVLFDKRTNTFHFGRDSFLGSSSKTLSMPSSEVKQTEAFIYIHGFNNTMEDSAKVSGQLAAFGNFPDHIKQIIFSWPSGYDFKGFFYAKRQTENEKNHRAFADFIMHLMKCGITNVNFLTHSMGAKMLLTAIQTLYHYKIFADADSPEFGSGSLVSIRSVTLVSPFHYLEDWINKDFTLLRKKCPVITVYADHNDRAIWWGTVFSRFRRVLGMHPLSNFTTQTGVMRDRYLNEIEPEEELTRMHKLCRYQERTGVWGDEGPRILKYKSKAWETIVPDGAMAERNNRSRKCAPEGKDVKWLDMDVIDTSFVEQNTDGRRHTYFAVNRDMIEDIRELIVFKRRAQHRTSRLDRRLGNVYTFRVAPAHINSVSLY